MSKIKVGIIGCGNISDIYFQAGQKFDILDIVACADLDPARTQAKAQQYGVTAYPTGELLADPMIEIVVNLTVPAAHFQVSLAAINAGKSVYSEKPLAITRADGARLLEVARDRGVLLGCAPDTFLGGGLQTCRKLIDDGTIGRPVAAAAFMLSHGPEAWHPDPEFFFQPGAGPMFDMGPYYLTALISLIGPLRRVTASAQISFAERVVGSGVKRGQKIPVQTPTHVAGVIDFEGGVVATLITSFDVWASQLPHIEIYGSQGSLVVPDPNRFDGPVYLCRAGETEWRAVELSHGYTENSRGIGLADLAYALRSNRPHRANGQMAYHVLDAMQAFLDASAQGRHIELASTCQRPSALPVGLRPGRLDD